MTAENTSFKLLAMNIAMRKRLARLMLDKSSIIEKYIAQNIHVPDLKDKMIALTKTPALVEIQLAITSAVKAIQHAEGMVITHRLSIPSQSGLNEDYVVLSKCLAKLLERRGYSPLSAYLVKAPMGYQIFLPSELEPLLLWWVQAIGVSPKLAELKKLNESEWHVSGLEDCHDAECFLTGYGYY